MNDEFAEMIGPNPQLDLVITDERAPYFHSGGVFMPRLSTLFLTSNLLRDTDPSAVSSANRRTEITKIEIFSPRNVARDKVRAGDEVRMTAGAAEYPNGDSTGLVVCVQGSLKESSGLVYIDTKRPHKSHMLLNNFQGRPFNSPCDVVANTADGSLYFTDPAYGWERGFRPKPQLPSGHIYRFEPETGECRVVANGHSRPAGLALWRDTLYVSELGDKHGGTNIFAYTLAHIEPARDSSQPSFQISVSNRGYTTSNHRSTPSGSTIGSQGSSSGYVPNASSSYSFNRTAPLSPQQAVAGAYGDVNRPPPTAEENNLRSPLHSSSSRWHFQRDRSHQRDGSNASTTNTSSRHSGRHSGPFLLNKRLFAYTPSSSSSGLISTDPRTGNVFLGTEEGVDVFSGESGDLIGRILVDEEEGLPVQVEEVKTPEKKRRAGEKSTTATEPKPSDGGVKIKKKKFQRGVSKVAFGLGGEFWLLGGERIWRGKMDWSGGGFDGIGF